MDDKINSMIITPIIVFEHSYDVTQCSVNRTQETYVVLTSDQQTYIVQACTYAVIGVRRVQNGSVGEVLLYMAFVSCP